MEGGAGQTGKALREHINVITARRNGRRNRVRERLARLCTDMISASSGQAFSTTQYADMHGESKLNIAGGGISHGGAGAASRRPLDGSILDNQVPRIRGGMEGAA